MGGMPIRSEIDGTHHESSILRQILNYEYLGFEWNKCPGEKRCAGGATCTINEAHAPCANRKPAIETARCIPALRTLYVQAFVIDKINDADWTVKNATQQLCEVVQ